MQNAVNDERKRALALLVAALTVGWIIEQLPWVLAATGMAWGAYMLWHGMRLLEWLNGGRKPPPAHSGLWAEIYSQLRRDRRGNESRRRKLLEVLRWYSDSADALPDAALILDQHHSIIGSNQAARHVLGIDNKRDRGQRVDNLLRDPALLMLLNGELPDSTIELPSPINASTTLRLRLAAYGAGSQLLLAQDISEHIRNQEMRQAFVANVSHELHTPLTVINGHLELLLDDPALTQEQLQQLNAVSRQSLRMQDLVRDLLSLARLESAPALTEGQDVAVAELIECSITTLIDAGQFSEHQATVQADRSLLLNGRHTEIESITHNLIGNALRYTPPGSLIAVQWYRQANGRPALKVSDNGPGIPAEHLPRLTERFYRADPSRSRELGGTGLGLAIVKHALQRHGGELLIDSQEGKGSEFLALFSAERAVIAQQM